MKDCTKVHQSHYRELSHKAIVFGCLRFLYLTKWILPNLKQGLVFFFFHYCLFCFVLFFSKGLFQRKLAQSITHRCQLLPALFPCARTWMPVCSLVPISVLHMPRWLPERLWMRNRRHSMSNWNKEGGHCVHWFDKALTCFLYCKVVMGSFITHRAPWHFTC